MKCCVLRIVFIASAFTIPRVVSAAPVPALNIAALVDRADFIVVGSLTRITDQGSVQIRLESGTDTPGRLVRATITIEQALKGQVGLPTVDVLFEEPDQPIA